MTDARLSASEIKVLREIIRRAGHEIRNALNGVAVNVEVVRSRSARDSAAGEVTAFAERAILNVSAATVLTNGLLALTNAAFGTGAAAAGGNAAPEKANKQSVAGGSVQVRLADASSVLSDIRRLAAAIDVAVEERGTNVILRVLPEGQSHSKD